MQGSGCSSGACPLAGVTGLWGTHPSGLPSSSCWYSSSPGAWLGREARLRGWGECVCVCGGCVGRSKPSGRSVGKALACQLWSEHVLWVLRAE